MEAAAAAEGAAPPVALWAEFFFHSFFFLRNMHNSRARHTWSLWVCFLRVGVDGDFCNHRHYQVAQSATSPSFKLNDDGSGSGIHLLLFSSSGGKQCLQGMRKLSKESKGREVWAGTSDILFCIYLIIIPNHWGLKLSSKDASHPQVYLIWVINVERG